MIYRKKIYPLDARSALIAKRQFLDFYTFVTNIRDYDNITFPRHIPNNLFIQSLSAYIIETNNKKLCKETFGTIDYSALTKVRDEISAKAAGVIHVFGDDEIIYNVNNKIMAIFHEKELLEDAGLLKVKGVKTKKIIPFYEIAMVEFFSPLVDWMKSYLPQNQEGDVKFFIATIKVAERKGWLFKHPSYNAITAQFGKLPIKERAYSNYFNENSVATVQNNYLLSVEKEAVEKYGLK